MFGTNSQRFRKIIPSTASKKTIYFTIVLKRLLTYKAQA